ncbi:MAG: hypothetical protein AB7L90_18585 [Hyphomicrobiaceae bacterium]
MQLSIWIFTISVVVGPVLLGLLLHRLGFSRAVAVGLAAVLLGGAILISREPASERGAELPVAPQQVSTASSPSQAVSPVTETAITAALVQTLLQEVRALRTKLASFDPERGGHASPLRIADLDTEKAAHAETKRALEVAKARIASLSAERAAPAAHSAIASTYQKTNEELQAARLRLAIANAEIERLKAAVRAAEPVATAASLPATPQPFAHAPARAEPAATTGKATEIATGTTSPRVSGASESASRSAAIGKMLAEAMRSRRFALVKLANEDLVAGRHGSYYRITCPGSGATPLSFRAGDYTFNGGYGSLEACFKALQALLLDALPADTGRRLYVQGYASQRGFIRPKAFPTRDTHLRSIEYLPRITGRDQFSTSKARQTTQRRFANADLPNLRAANVAHWIDRASKGAIRPEILEGELQPGNNATSQSFCLLLHVTW